LPLFLTGRIFTITSGFIGSFLSNKYVSISFYNPGPSILSLTGIYYVCHFSENYYYYINIFLFLKK